MGFAITGRPRAIVHLAIVATISITLWLTLGQHAHRPLQSSSSGSSSPSIARPPFEPPVLLEANPRNMKLDAPDTTSLPWEFTSPKEDLQPCEKIFLFSFLPWWGFASEFILYIRAKSMADKLGYTFLPDDSAWNYGRLRNYFAPQPLSCIPPHDWDDPRKAYPIHQGKSWRNDQKGRPRKRLRYSRAFLSNLDDWTRDTYFDGDGTLKAELEKLGLDDETHRANKDRWILEEGGTLPRVFERIFEDHASAVQDTWYLTEKLQHDAHELASNAGFTLPRRMENSETGRGPVIGLHVRLGDKAAEYLHDAEEMGITNEFGNLTVYIEAAHDAYRRLVSSDYPPLSPSRDVAPRFSPHARPTLLLMTAEPGVADELSRLPLARSFRIVQTPSVHGTVSGAGGKGSDSPGVRGAAAQRIADSVARPKAYAKPSSDSDAPLTIPSGDLRDGYTQSTFNSMPLGARVEHTKAFVRDLALLTSGDVDAVVVSGASNIGRLAMLLGGSEAVIGPRNADGHALGGKIRSIDAHFYPTAYPASVYNRNKDVEDLDNAAVLPDEQLHRAKAKAGTR